MVPLWISNLLFRSLQYCYLSRCSVVHYQVEWLLGTSCQGKLLLSKRRKNNFFEKLKSLFSGYASPKFPNSQIVNRVSLATETNWDMNVIYFIYLACVVSAMVLCLLTQQAMRQFQTWLKLELCQLWSIPLLFTTLWSKTYIDPNFMYIFFETFKSKRYTREWSS